MNASYTLLYCATCKAVYIKYSLFSNKSHVVLTTGERDRHPVSPVTSHIPRHSKVSRFSRARPDIWKRERTHAYCLTASMPTSLALAWDLVFTLGCVPGRVHSRLMAFLGSARLGSMACVLSVGSAASVVGVASVVGAVSKT